MRCENGEITLREIGFDNVRDVLALSRGDVSEAFVESAAETIAYAYCGTLAGLGGFCCAICVGEVPVGICLIGEAMPGPCDPEEAVRAGRFFRLTGFFIDAAYRGRGIGREALQRILATCDVRYPGCPILLGCHEDNAAAYRLYEAAGFAEMGVKNGCYRQMLRRGA